SKVERGPDDRRQLILHHCYQCFAIVGRCPLVFLLKNNHYVSQLDRPGIGGHFSCSDFGNNLSHLWKIFQKDRFCLGSGANRFVERRARRKSNLHRKIALFKLGNKNASETEENNKTYDKKSARDSKCYTGMHQSTL